MAPRNPKVSVCLITYNHEKYIAQAIESVLMQRTNFDYSVIIGEDDSEDRTREIVVRYAENYPEKIKLLLNDRANVIYINGRPTGRWNLVNTMNQSEGEYIALLEGDDYWTDPHKLQKQVDFLENNLECVICFHPIRRINEYKNSPIIIYPNNLMEKKGIFTIEDLLYWNMIPTCSVIFRNGLIKYFPDWFFQGTIGDWPLHVLNAMHGYIGYINHIMGVHRAHDKGIFSGKNLINRLEMSLEVRELIKPHLIPRYQRILNRVIFNYSYRLAKLYQKNGNISKTKYYLRKSLILYRYNTKISLWNYLKFYILLFFPYTSPIYHNIKSYLTGIFKSLIIFV